MRKLLCVIVAMFIFILSGCSSASSPDIKDTVYKINRVGVTEVSGTSQTSDPVKDVVIPKESVEQLLNQIDGLRLQIADKDYAAKGWDYLFNVKYDDGSTIQISLSGETVKIDGKVKIALNSDIRKDCTWLPRLGFEFKTAYDNDSFTYFGRGELENYQDMKNHTKIGFFDSTADREFVNYSLPQEHGNHMDTKLLQMKNGLKFTTDDRFDFNVSHYSAHAIHKAKHIDELVRADSTIIRIDYKNSGVGSNSCGPVLPEKYRLCEKEIRGFSFVIKP